jgi:DNA-binding response OmpR family regulator
MTRMLIIEDSPAQLQRVVEILTKAGHNARGAEDWAGCRAALHDFDPEVVILDVNLGAMQGGDILALQLRKHPKTQKARIIFHSAAKVADLEVMVRRAGADGYIVKSKNDAALLEAITKLL